MIYSISNQALEPSANENLNPLKHNNSHVWEKVLIGFYFQQWGDQTIASMPEMALIVTSGSWGPLFPQSTVLQLDNTTTDRECESNRRNIPILAKSER